MLARILVPLDGSSLSERVLPIAQRLAQSFDAKIDLLYVIPTPTDEIPEALTIQATEDGKHYLEKISRHLTGSPSKAQASYSVQVGHPASLIIEQAESQPGSLVLMSTHGYSGLKKLLLGSTAGKVVQAANSPVLLVPAGATNPEGKLVEFKKAIVPLDGSRLAECVLPLVVHMCKVLEMELILVRSYNPSFPGTSVRMHDVSQIVHDAAENYVKEKARELQGAGLRNISYEVLRGVPAEQITDLALATPNSLTAMCTHGRHGVSRWLLGSVTNAVLHCAEEPVLVVRGSGVETEY